jgi:PAS domain S-box-containing protein
VTEQEKQARDLNRELLELVHALNQASDFQAALEALVERARRRVLCDGAAVMWLDGDYLEVVASRGATAPMRGLTLPVSQMGAARSALDSGRPVAVFDTAQDPAWEQVPGEEKVRAWLGVPLIAEDWTVGLLEWTGSEPGLFDEDDLHAAGEIGRSVASVLQRAQLLDDARRRLRERADPRSGESARSGDLGAELQPVVREALDYTSARHAFVFLLADGTRRLYCAAASGERRDLLSRVVLRGDGTLGGSSASTPRWTDWSGTGASDRETMAALGIERTLILPLRVDGEQVGMLGVAEPRRGRSFSRDSMRLMTHLASQASLIVEHSHHSRRSAAQYDYEMVFKSSPLGIAVLTVTGDIQICNPALGALLSRSDRSLLGANLSEFILRADSQRVMRVLEEVAISGQRRQVDARVRSLQGDHREVRLSLALADVSGQEGGELVAMMEDVTPLKILEQERVEHLRQLREKHAQLQELDQLKSRFVSNVSHELRTPLAVIKLYATLARKGRPEKRNHYMQTIEQETHRLETMVENILDLTRMDRQALRVNPELLNAEEIVAQVLQVYEETAQSRSIELRNRVQAPLPKLWADKNHLIQMLTNLVDNAIKYTPRMGQVWVAARVGGSDSDRMLEIAVGDTGVGIAEEEQDKVFERFFRGSNNTSTSTGTGLGLAIVRELMALHGGTVNLKSQTGEGSVFALHFPLYEEGKPSDEYRDE